MQKSRGLERKFNISATAGRIVLWLHMVEDDMPCYVAVAQRANVRDDASGTIIFLFWNSNSLFPFSLSFIIMTKTDYKTHTPFHDAH